MSFSIEKARKWAYTYFNENKRISNVIVEIDYILSYILNWNRSRLYAYPEYELNEWEIRNFKRMVKKRDEGVPFHYLMGKKEFMGFDFLIDENVLIPRPETELLVEEGLKSIEILKEKFPSLLLALEPFTGCGAIALSLAKLANDRPPDDLKIYAGDISEKALNIARQNKNQLKVNDEKVIFYMGNLFSPLPKEKKFHLILANPPYIPTEELTNLSLEVNKEPVIALDGGEDGLYYYRKIKQEYKNYLSKDGIMLLEIGEHQKDQVMDMFSNEGKNVQTSAIKDLEGRPRIIKIHHKCTF